ncbi:MAG: TonB-dependent receptor [Hyphomonadaceae bacterium]|nr:TonB-dependent receptor [Hyphomonadaceae bacterium]
MTTLRSRKFALMLGALATTPFALPTPAIAQEAPAIGNDDEIIVTARRRAESLQDVPLAVTAFTAERLDQTGAADLTALQRATPNVTFEVSRGTNSTLTAFIRGVGQQDPVWNFEPGVGLYVDDVYIARPQGALLDIYDVERLEVLRGPQGTLYGRNTIGGAIKYVTRRIEDEPTLRSKVSVGSYGQLDWTVAGSAPLTDYLAVSGAFATLNREGYGRNVTTGADHYDKDVRAGRATVEFTPTDDFFLRLAYDRTEDKSNAKHGHREIPGVTGNFPVLPDVYDTRAGAGDKNSVDTQGASLQAEWQVSDAFTLKSITGWREGETSTPIDFDGLPGPDLDIPANYYDEQLSQEFQLLYQGDRLSGVAGVYYLSSFAGGEFDTILGNLFVVGFTPYTAGKANTRSLSAFADFTYDLSDQWSVSLGGRYTEDDKTATVFRQNFLGRGSTYFGSTTSVPTPNLAGSIATNFTSNRVDEKFSPRVSLSYEPTDDLMLYASYSQGFKSGGFDPRANFQSTATAAGRALILSGFAPEIVDSYEAGFKGNFFDDRLRLNTAFFFADYSDQQITVQQGVDTNGDGVNDNVVSSVFNAGASEYAGVEVEGSLLLTQNLTAGFTVGYIDAEITEVISNGVNLQTNATTADDFVVQNTPELTGSASLNWTGELPNDLGSLSVTGSASYRDEYFIFNVEAGGFSRATPAPTSGPKLDPDATTLLDLSAVWTTKGERFSLGLHGKNLSDERYRVAYYNFARPSAAAPAPTGVDSSYSAFYGPPRTITATFGVKF